jgi:cytidylate kinase
MLMQASLFDSCKGYIQAHADRHTAHKSSPLPSVTISRETGAGAVTIGQKVIDLIQERKKSQVPWALFDRNLVERVIEDHQLPKTIKEFMPEDVRLEITSTVEEILGLHPSTWTMVEHTTETILRLASAGHAILIGRGANFVTAKLPNVLHVRLVAPIELRIQRIRKLRNLSEREAAIYVHKEDRARQRYVKRHFHGDIDDPLQYDITLNTGSISIETAAQVIADATLRLVE